MKKIVSIFDRKSKVEIKSYPIVLNIENGVFTDDDYFQEAWKSFVEDHPKVKDKRSKYKLVFRRI